MYDLIDSENETETFLVMEVNVHDHKPDYSDSDVITQAKLQGISFNGLQY